MDFKTACAKHNSSSNVSLSDKEAPQITIDEKAADNDDLDIDYDDEFDDDIGAGESQYLSSKETCLQRRKHLYNKQVAKKKDRMFDNNLDMFLDLHEELLDKYEPFGFFNTSRSTSFIQEIMHCLIIK